MAITPATIFSTLGNPNSLIPLAVKDMSATAGMTAGSFVTGKEEGQDRLIDELGTQIIWLLGIPAFKALYNCTVFKAFGFDSKFDPRNLANGDVFEKIKKYSPDEKIKQEVKKIGEKQNLFKNIVSTRFVVSTAMTIASYIMLTKFKQKYTENKIRQNLIDEYKKDKEGVNIGVNMGVKEGANISSKAKEIQNNSVSEQPSFKGIGPMVEKFAFSPVRNMWILDGAITAERLKDSRSPQEFVGYGIKEAATLTFMYYAGGKIQEFMEKQAIKKHNKSIGLDARVLEDGSLKEAFENGSVEKSLKKFKLANKNDADLYEFLHTNPENLIVKTAKQSDIISLYKNTNKIDTRKFIALEEVKEINNKVEILYKQYKDALLKGESSEKFFAGVKKLKRRSVIANIGSCIFALGIATPAIMLAKRILMKDDTEFQTKKEIREQLINEGIIA